MARRADIRTPCILAEAYERLANFAEESSTHSDGVLDEDGTRGRETSNESTRECFSTPPTNEEDEAAMSPTSRLLSVSQADNGATTEDDIDVFSPLETSSANPLMEGARKMSQARSRDTWDVDEQQDPEGVKTNAIEADKNSFPKQPTEPRHAATVESTSKSRQDILEEGEQVSRYSSGETFALFRECRYAAHTYVSFPKSSALPSSRQWQL